MAWTRLEMSRQLRSPQEARSRPFSSGLSKGPGSPLWALSPLRSGNTPWVSLLSQKPGYALADPPGLSRAPRCGLRIMACPIQGLVKTKCIPHPGPGLEQTPFLPNLDPKTGPVLHPTPLPSPSSRLWALGTCRPRSLYLCLSPCLFPLQGSLALAFRKPWRQSPLLDTSHVPKSGLDASPGSLHHAPNVHDHSTDHSGLGLPHHLPRRVYNLREEDSLGCVPIAQHTVHVHDAHME